VIRWKPLEEWTYLASGGIKQYSGSQVYCGRHMISSRSAHLPTYQSIAVTIPVHLYDILYSKHLLQFLPRLFHIYLDTLRALPIVKFNYILKTPTFLQAFYFGEFAINEGTKISTVTVLMHYP
jgi:hypothetical protein